MQEPASPPVIEAQPVSETDLGRTSKYLDLIVSLCTDSRERIGGRDNVFETLKDRDLSEPRRKVLELQWQTLNERVIKAGSTKGFLNQPDLNLYYAQPAMEFLLGELTRVEGFAASDQYGENAQKNMRELGSSIQNVLAERVIPHVNLSEPPKA